MELYYLNAALLNFLIALIVNLPRQDKATENWAKLFGCAQVIIAIQGLVIWQTGFVLERTAFAFSALNNLFYLGAALLLLENLGANWRYLLSHRKFQIATLVSVVAIGLLALDWLLAGQNPTSESWFHKVAVVTITLTSMVVYLVEGAAFFYVLGLFRHWLIRYLPVLIAAISCVLELLIWQENDLRPYNFIISGIRYLYYIPALLIVLPRRPQYMNKVFGTATNERKFILAKETGFVEAIGRSTAAHKVLLLIKMPNFNHDDSRSLGDDFIQFGWHDKDGEEAGGGKGDPLADITEEERRCVYHVCRSDNYSDKYEVCKLGDGKETIILPIIMYGGMIGVLFVRLYKGAWARAILVERLKLAVQAILPFVQSSRQMAAIRMLSDHFTTNLIGDGRIDGAWRDAAKVRVTDGVSEILGSLLETLSPLGVALKPSLHFNSAEPALWQIAKSGFPTAEKEAFERRYFAAAPNDMPFEGVLPFQQDLELGRLIMFVHQGKDPLNRPTIGIHANVFNALGALINNTLKTIIRRNQYRILMVADERISKAAADGQHIARVLQEAAQAFGITWVVVALDQNSFFGDDERVALVRQSDDVPMKDGEFAPAKVTTADGRAAWVIPFSNSWEANSLSKSNSPARHRVAFWFGVERPDFQWDETWQRILAQFVQFGTIRMKEMLMMKMEMESDQRIAEIEKSKPIMTLVNLWGNLAHQFGSHVKDVECAIMNVEMDIEEFQLELPDRLGQDMSYLKESHSQLLKLTHAMFSDALGTRTLKGGSVEGSDEHCDLRAAISNALADVDLKANRYSIAIDRNGSQDQGEVPIEVPYTVAYLSIYNLLSNSIKSLSGITSPSHKKRIDIKTTVNGDKVCCRITDTGQGIKDVANLYALESGFGLHITRISLQDNNSMVELIETDSSGTTFELRFPLYLRK